MWEKNAPSLVVNAAKKKMLSTAKGNVHKEVDIASSITKQHLSNSSQLILGNEAQLLGDLSNSYNSAFSQLKLQNTLDRPDSFVYKNDLVAAAQKMDFLDACEAACSMIGSGQVNDASQVISFWSSPNAKRHITLSQRHQATRAFEAVISDLGAIGDVSSLRTLVDVLESSLNAQHSNTATDTYTKSCQYKLFVPLGKKRIAKIFTTAVKTIVAMDEKNVSLIEKIVLLDRCTRPCMSLHRQKEIKIMPFELQQCFTDFVESSPQYTEELLDQVSHTMSSSFVHPSQLDILQTLCLSTSEARYIAEHWDSAEPLKGVKNSNPTVKQLLGNMLKKSSLLKNAELNNLLISLKANKERKEKSKVVNFNELPMVHQNLRAQLVELIYSSNSKIRNAASRQLLSNPGIMESLCIPPKIVMKQFALSFRSRSITPKFASLCGSLVKELHGKGEFSDAAFISWNHLSLEKGEVVEYFKNNNNAFDSVTSSILKYFRKINPSDMHHTAWMGYRTLSILNNGVAADIVTPLHSILLCIMVLDAGAPFSSVSTCLQSVYAKDETTARWCLNVIRLFTKANEEDKKIVLSSFRKNDVVKQLVEENKNKEITVAVPNRSQQLALWSLLNDPTINRSLLAIVLKTYFSEEGTKLFLEGNDIQENGTEKEDIIPRALPSDSAEKEIRKYEQLLKYDIMAAIASNCTTSSSLETILSALKTKVDTAGENSNKNTKIERLLMSEQH